MANIFKGERGVNFHNINSVQAKNLLWEGVHLGRSGSE